MVVFETELCVSDFKFYEYFIGLKYYINGDKKDIQLTVFGEVIHSTM